MLVLGPEGKNLNYLCFVSLTTQSYFKTSLVGANLCNLNTV